MRDIKASSLTLLIHEDRVKLEARESKGSYVHRLDLGKRLSRIFQPFR